MKNSVKLISLLFSMFFSIPVWAQDLDDGFNKVISFIQMLNDFSSIIPQEKVYLHFDNTGYYQGDNIWFKCYVVTSGQHQLSQLSKTLYVELLNPGGEITDKRILKIENGQCHGDFSLDQLPFYSGFYEVRAYTKYMLNFGEDAIFSRLLPVFDKPKTEGDFEEKKMLGYGRYGSFGGHPMKREQPLKGKSVNLRFYPEGGNLIQGIESHIAFEATDEAGNPIDVTGVVMDAAKQEICQIATLHEGRGAFAYTPGDNKRKDIAEVEYNGKRYRFDMPAGLLQGVVMEVDNLSDSDSIGIALRKNSTTPAEMLGVVILSGGKLQNYCCVWMENDEVNFKMDKTPLPSGVSQVVLFNSKGEILCDRLIFSDRHEKLDIKAKTGKPFHMPLELVEMSFSVLDRKSNPMNTTFSLSVRDGANAVEGNYTILTDLLLMSEIKGYVRNPSYYFEDDDEMRRAALDVLLMVQGWRRYSWRQMAEIEPFELKYLPEQGIETNGQIVSLTKQKPQPNVDVGLFLLKTGQEDEEGKSAVETFVTDDNGRFSFVSDVDGKWSMILTVREKGKKKNHRILLDRIFNPAPRRYRYADLQINIAEKNNENINNDETSEDEDTEDDFKSFFAAYQDSLAKLGLDEKIHLLPEVTVKARRSSPEQDLFRNRSTSKAYYDVASEADDIYDSGKFIGNDIHELMMNMNEDFSTKWTGNDEFLYYKGRLMFFVVNYDKTRWTPDYTGYFKYKNINLSAIKSLYINENESSMAQYIDPPSPLVSPEEIISAVNLSCVVFIETHPEGDIPVESVKGVRKTWLEGYSAVKEFYNPDYSTLPPAPDYRRTIYWNPMVTTDENGKATIQFYNNSSCKNFNISAETVTPFGTIGIYNDE